MLTRQSLFQTATEFLQAAAVDELLAGHSAVTAVAAPRDGRAAAAAVTRAVTDAPPTPSGTSAAHEAAVLRKFGLPQTERLIAGT